ARVVAPGKEGCRFGLQLVPHDALVALVRTRGAVAVLCGLVGLYEQDVAILVVRVHGYEPGQWAGRHLSFPGSDRLARELDGQLSERAAERFLLDIQPVVEVR